MKANYAGRRAARFHRHAIALSFEGDALPTEFRLFQKGWNDTENGKYLFDEKAAKAVMASYEAWGVELAIDLEHQMLDVEAGAPDPTARDARGWCRLEIRSGELWACEVRWAPDGAQRLREKRQRYVSPAFEADPKTKRVLKMINVAITSIPATHNTPALVAASAKGTAMKSDHVQAAIDAIEKGDHKAALDLMKSMLADAATDGDEDGAESDGAEGTAPPKGEKEEDSAIDPTVKEENDVDVDDDDEDGPAKKTERKAMSVLLSKMTGKATLAESLAEVETWKASHVTLATERANIARERAVLEAEERRALCVSLVKLGAEFPATVWADDKAKKLKARWQNMPIAELRTHVSEQRAARGGKERPAAVQPPPGDAAPEGVQQIEVQPGVMVELSAAELKICADTKCEPKVFAQLKARRDGKVQ